ncbi:MAG: hypothetical protein IKY00_00670, partial [Clostridia bacterium]|nr:hypothetical protein [Clostridia bacterium]
KSNKEQVRKCFAFFIFGAQRPVTFCGSKIYRIALAIYRIGFADISRRQSRYIAAKQGEALIDKEQVRKCFAFFIFGAQRPYTDCGAINITSEKHHFENTSLRKAEHHCQSGRSPD